MNGRILAAYIQKEVAENPAKSRHEYKIFKGMKNVNKITKMELLSCKEMSGIFGGTATSSIWHDIGYLGGLIVQGLIVFGTEGGRNAGLVVR